MYCPFYLLQRIFLEKLVSATGLPVNSQERSSGKTLNEWGNNNISGKTTNKWGNNRISGKTATSGETEDTIPEERPQTSGETKGSQEDLRKDHNEWGNGGMETTNGLADLPQENDLLEKSPAGDVK